MTGRALVFSNPDVLQLIKTSFVPYAGDQWYLHRQKDSPGQFFWKVAQQGHYKNQPRDATRQGIYVAAPDGQLLASDHFHPAPERMLALLKSSLEKWKERPKTTETTVATDTAADASTSDARYTRQPPEGGLILNVFSRIPLPPAAGGAWTPNHATGRDHMWLTGDEWRALLPAQWRTGVRYPVPAAVAQRLVRFHLVDNVRGEPPMWQRDEVKLAELTLRVADGESGRLALEGTARMQSPAASGDEGNSNGRDSDGRGYDARIQGFLTYDHKAQRFTSFDLLVWGEAWGEGTYTRNAPKGRFPLVIAASLAGNSPADRIPPQASRDYRGYFGAG